MRCARCAIILGAGPPAAVVAVQSFAAAEGDGEHHRVFECLAGALAEVGSHGLGGATGQRDLAGGNGGQRRELVQVVVEHYVIAGRLQQGRDRVVPAAEPAAQPGNIYQWGTRPPPSP